MITSSTKYWTQNLLVDCIICLHLKLVNKNYINYTWQESSTLMITSQNEDMTITAGYFKILRL